MSCEEDQVSLFGQDTWSGKMSSEPSAVTKGPTLPPFSRKRSGSSNRTRPICLCLKRDGATQELSWATDGASLGELTMRNTGECPNVVVESQLSAILEDTPHPKYSLSAKACLGILRRAKKRGKQLPEILEWVLKVQSLVRTVAQMQEDGKAIPPVVYRLLEKYLLFVCVPDAQEAEKGH